MAMLALLGCKFQGVRLALVVVDRCDLASQAAHEFKDFFAKCYKTPKQKSEERPQVHQVTAASELESWFDALLQQPKLRCVLVVTLQSFPHLQRPLPAELQDKTVILADEVHRSHADRSFSEEMEKAVGIKPRLFLFTGTASDRCLRLFGVRQGQYFVPFHAVSEGEAPCLHLTGGNFQPNFGGTYGFHITKGQCGVDPDEF